MIVLPSYPARRAWVTSFGLAVSILGGAVGIILGAVSSPPAGAGVLALSATAAAISGYRPQLVRFPYRVWNAAAYRAAGLGRSWLIWSSFRIVFAIMGRVESHGRALSLDRIPRHSLWEERRPREGNSAGRSPSAAYDVPGAVNLRFPVFVSWLRGTENFWAVALVPFLLLLAQFDGDESDGSIREDIYTLF
jgi:hypothetical protein